MSENEFKYKAGACVIGSLLWNKADVRVDWQRNSFSGKLIPVTLPIRYGRFSDGWKAPTMVFSSEYYEQGKVGRGYVIPFKLKTYSIEELIWQARAMSKAEGEDDSGFIKGKSKWCIMLCWTNPEMKKEMRDQFLKAWQKEYGEDISKDIQAHFKMENEHQAVFDQNGELQFRWPDELKEFDVVFATQTQPRKRDNVRSSYFSSKELCQLIFKEKEYFTKNIQNGILTKDDSAILKALMDNEAIIYYRNEFRNARYQALLNAEDFAPLLFVLESFGGYLAKLCESDDWGLSELKKYLKAFVSDSPYLTMIPDKYPVHHCEFDFLYEFVRDTRNEFAHKGVYARQKTRFVLELCLIFESKLNELEMKASNYAVSGVTTAELWQPLSLIRKEMLINSFSYLPVYYKGYWKLVSDYNLAVYLRGSKNQRGKKESQTLKHAIEKGNTLHKGTEKEKTYFLNLEEAETMKPDVDISDKELKSTKPILVVTDEKDLKSGETYERLHGLFTGFDLL